MLLLIGQDMCNRMVLQLQTNQVVPNIVIEWGDGTDSTEATYSPNTTSYYYVHDYDYETLEAPKTTDGYKQVILTVKDDPSKEPIDLTYVAPSSYTSSPQTSNYSLVRKVSAQAGLSNKSMQLGFGSVYLLQSIVAHNIKQVSASICPELSELKVTGDNFTYFSTTYSNLSRFNVPNNAYTTFSMGNSRTQELILDLSNLSTTTSTTSIFPSFTNSRFLKHLKLNGLRRGFNLTYSPMTRDAIIELFESLGQADITLPDSARTINLTSLPAYPQLTPEDKAIATGKGFVVT